MQDDQRKPLRRVVPTAAERDQTIALLSDRFAQGELDMDTFEERVTVAHRTESLQELTDLTADLSVLSPAVAPQTALETVTDPPPSGEAMAIFGGVQRVGRWPVPRRLRVVAVFGGVEMDLREAQLPAGRIDIDVKVVFGGLQLIVPPTLAVEVHGSAVFGGFEQLDRVPPSPDPAAPMLHIHGKAIFGGVSIETRLPGESQGMAHRRRRSERRARRHQRRLKG